METKKKKLSKKKVIIGSVILAVVLFGVVYGLLYYYAYIWEPKEKEKFTFEQITQGLSEKVDHVEYEESTLTEDFEKKYYNTLLVHKYVKAKNIGSGELQVKIVFYDEFDNILFYVKMYRYGFIIITQTSHTETASKASLYLNKSHLKKPILP